MLEGFKFTRDSAFQFTALFIFPEADIEEVVLSSERMASPQITAGAKAIAKKLGHAFSEGTTSAFAGTPVTQEAAEVAIKDIMGKPVKVVRLGETTKVFSADGRGVWFRTATRKFISFLEGSKP